MVKHQAMLKLDMSLLTNSEQETRAKYNSSCDIKERHFSLKMANRNGREGEI